MNVTPEWITVVLTFVAGISAVLKVMLDFNRVVDGNTAALKNINQTLDRMRDTVDGHGERLIDHGERIIKVETYQELKK
jgi:hypothetical protein